LTCCTSKRISCESVTTSLKLPLIAHQRSDAYIYLYKQDEERMPANPNKYRNILWTFAFFLFILVSVPAVSMSENMDSLPKPFTIEIDGKPVSKAGAIPDGREQAKVGSEPAVFELKNKRLECDGHILARSLLEDRSFLPKRVYWFPADSSEQTHDVTASKDGEEYRLHFSSMCDAGVGGCVHC